MEHERPLMPGDGSLKGRCLLVDDEPAVRQTSRSLLQEAGLSVVEASDGIEAIEIYAEHGDDIDVVLMDITMPRMDGYQALMRIREMDPEARVIISTGNVQDAEEVELEWGVPLLAKPYGSQELRAVLARLLEQQPAQPVR